MTNYTPTSQVEYLTSPDGLNRFNLTSLRKIPRYSKIQVGFSLNRLEKMRNEKFKNYDIDSQLTAVLLIYFNLGKLPKVNYKQHVFSKKYNYSMLSTFSNNKQIYSFIFSFFIENRYRAYRDDKIFYRESATANMTAVVFSPFFFTYKYLLSTVLFNVNPWKFALEIIFFVDSKKINPLNCRTYHEFEIFEEDEDAKNVD